MRRGLGCRCRLRPGGHLRKQPLVVAFLKPAQGVADNGDQLLALNGRVEFVERTGDLLLLIAVQCVEFSHAAEAALEGGDRFLGIGNLGLDLGRDLLLQGFDLRLHLLHAVALETFRIGQAGEHLSGFVAFDVGEVGLLALNELAGVIEDAFLRAAHEFTDRIDDAFLHIEQRVFLAG